MAQTQNKKKTSSTGSRAKSSTKSTASSKKKSTRSAAPAKRPIRREVGGAVCLVLALFSAAGYVPTDAIFIKFFADLLKGLFGYGFWIVPPTLFCIALILLFHHGRPVRLRIVCMSIAAVAIGTVLQILLCKVEFHSAAAIIKNLYQTGISMTSGGVICGGIGYGFVQFFGVFASITVCGCWQQCACCLDCRSILWWFISVYGNGVWSMSRNRRQSGLMNSPAAV